MEEKEKLTTYYQKHKVELTSDKVYQKSIFNK